MVLVTLAHRQQGLLVAPGNPKQIRGLEDLGREDVTLVNRNRGSGTRLWLDTQLEQLGILPERMRGYNQEARTHTAVAQAIQHGRADAGLGLYAAARLAKLEFIPIFQERYDLVLPEEQYRVSDIQNMLNYLQSRQFRSLVDSLGGYDTGHTGEELHP
jgi:putative molybdopterin biosynthesis protein